MQEKNMDSLKGIYSSVDSVVSGLFGKLYAVYQEGAGALHLELGGGQIQISSDKSSGLSDASVNTPIVAVPQSNSSQEVQEKAIDEREKEEKKDASSDDDDDDGSDQNNNSGSSDSPSIGDPKEQIVHHFNDAIAALSALRDEVGAMFNQADSGKISQSIPSLANQELVAPITEPETFE